MKAPDLGKMIGPLPLGGWLAAGGAGLAIAWYLKRKGGSATVTDSAAPDASADTSVPGVTGGMVPLAGSGSDSNSATASGPPAPTSNDEWGQLAITTAIAHGFNALTATKAVGDYLNGLPLDVAETAMLTLLLGLIGPPPTGTPPIQSTPPPTTGTGPVLGTPSRIPRSGNTIVATAYRHDGKGGYGVTSSGGLVEITAANGTKAPAATWRSVDRRAHFVPGAHPISISIDPNDAHGVVTDSKGGTHDFTMRGSAKAAA